MAPPGANRRGIIALLISTAVFTANDATVKFITRALPIGEIVFIRGFLVVVCMLSVLAAMGQFNKLPLLLDRKVGARAFFDGCATGFFVLALVHMNLADVVSILLASPLMLTALSVVFLNELVGWRRWSAIAVGMLGTLFIVKPTTGAFDVWALLGLASAASSAARDLMTHRIDHKIPAIAVGATASMSVMIVAIFIGLTEQWRVPTSGELSLITMAALLHSLGSFLIVLAFRGVDISVVSPFRYTLLLWALIFGYAILGEIPDPWSFVGASLIVASGIYTLHREAVRHRNITGDTPPQ